MIMAFLTGGMPGVGEIALILLILLLLFGAKRLPQLARALGGSLAEFRRGRIEGGGRGRRKRTGPKEDWTDCGGLGRCKWYLMREEYVIVTERPRNRNRTWAAVLAASVLCAVMCEVVRASPSGLNNIPNVDVAGRNVLVFQVWGNYASGASPAYIAGFKYGLPADIEIGLDSRVDSDDGGPLTGQAKWRIPLPGADAPYAALIGVANISDDRDDAGEADPYVVTGFDLDLARLSLGYSFQEDNYSFFAGLDETFTVQSRDLVPRADVRQIQDGDEWLLSAGLLHVLPLNLVFEGWVSVPTADGAEEVYTAKLNYVIEF